MWPFSVLMLAPALLVATGLAYRARVTRTIEREYARRFPLDANGIAEGAHEFTLHGNTGKALLLLHGSGDSPQSLRYLGEQLNATGYTVYAPLLPGHGRSPRAFAMATANDYHSEVRRALAQLRQSHEWIGLVGLSMGGALAAYAAREAADVRLLVLIAPYLVPPPQVRWAQRVSPLWRWAVPYLRGRGEGSVHDVNARDESRAYGSFSAAALTALVDTADAGRDALSALTLPTLVVNSETDNRIPRASAEAALRVFRVPVESHWVRGCGHVVTVDYCKARVAELVLAFLARHAGVLPA
ncbi:MAG: putative esterase [Gemmatimonadetes bacterium]|nr:putative esterase [Gemmatimonadota bacterium]